MAASTPTRRAILVAGLGAGTAALAACSAPEVASGPAGSSGAPPLPAGTVIHPLASIPVGGTASTEVNGVEILLSQPTEGQVAAFSATCPHQGCRVAAKGAEFDCPCHGSRFDAATGAVLAGPAAHPLTPLTVTISGDDVIVR